jgi:hypothetical protein
MIHDYKIYRQNTFRTKTVLKNENILNSICIRTNSKSANSS